MTLRKDQGLEIITGTAEQLGIAATPDTPGYYTTVLVVTTLLDSSQSASTVADTIAEGSPYSVRAATYDEIVNLVWQGLSTDLCGIKAFIQNTLMNTQFQFVPLYEGLGTVIKNGVAAPSKDIITVANIDGQGVGLAYASKTSEDPWPSSVLNPLYQSPWDFYDYYTCTISNGVEEIEPI